VTGYHWLHYSNNGWDITSPIKHDCAPGLL